MTSWSIVLSVYTEPSLIVQLLPLLQVLDSTKRLGCDQMGGFGPLKEHIFFEGMWYMYT